MSDRGGSVVTRVLKKKGGGVLHKKKKNRQKGSGPSEKIRGQNISKTIGKKFRGSGGEQGGRKIGLGAKVEHPVRPFHKRTQANEGIGKGLRGGRITARKSEFLEGG